MLITVHTAGKKGVYFLNEISSGIVAGLMRVRPSYRAEEVWTKYQIHQGRVDRCDLV